MDNIDLPDLETLVGLYGHTERDELGGPPCLAVIAGIIVGN